MKLPLVAPEIEKREIEKVTGQGIQDSRCAITSPNNLSLVNLRKPVAYIASLFEDFGHF